MSGALSTLRVPALALGRATLGGTAGNLVGALLLAGTLYGLASGRYRRFSWPTFPPMSLPRFNVAGRFWWDIASDCGGVWKNWYPGVLNCNIEASEPGLGAPLVPGANTALANIFITRPPHRLNLGVTPIVRTAVDFVRRSGAPTSIPTPVHSPSIDLAEERAPPLGWLAPYPEPDQETRNRAVPLPGVPPWAQPARRRRGVYSASIPHAFVEGGRWTSDGPAGPRRANVPLTFVLPLPRAAARPDERRSSPAMAYASTADATRDRSGDLVMPAYALSRPGEASRPDVRSRPIAAAGVEAGATLQDTWAVQLTRYGVQSVARSAAQPARPGEKEIKVAFRQASAFASTIKYNFTTELRDFVQSLWDNIPDDCKKFRSRRNLRGKKFRNIADPRTRLRPGDPNRQPLIVQGLRKPGRPTLARMMQDVYNHADCIQWTPWQSTRPNRYGQRGLSRSHRGALLDLDLNQLEDTFYGGLGNAAKKAGQRLGTTAGLQFGGGINWGSKVGSDLGIPSPVDWAANLIGI